MKGRVVVLKEYAKPFVIEEYDVPEPGPGAVLLEMTQAGICGSDLHSWRGDREQRFHPIPAAGSVMGHEGPAWSAGSVKASSPTGPGSRCPRETASCTGRRAHASGAASAAAAIRISAPGRPGNTRPEAGVWPFFSGTYADYLYLTPDRPFYVVPGGASRRVALLGELRDGHLGRGARASGCGPGDYVVIQGAGGLGLCAAALASYRGAARVIVLDRLDDRLELARRFGADHTINVDEVDTVEARRERDPGAHRRRGR